MNIVADVPLKCRANERNQVYLKWRANERRAELVRAMPSAADIMKLPNAADIMKLPNAADIMKRGYMHILTQHHVFMISKMC